MTHDLTPRVLREYDAEAARYDHRWAAYLRGSMALLRPWLAEAPPRDLLDVGCGTAYLLEAMRGWGMEPARYLGVDPSPAMRRRAAARGATAVPGTAEAIPVRSGAFGTVASVSSLHYWPRPEDGVREMRRVLAPGGRILLADWSRDFLSMRLLDAYLRATGHAYVRTYAEDEGRAMLEGAGLRVTRARRGRAAGMWGLWALEARGD